MFCSSIPLSRILFPNPHTSITQCEFICFFYFVYPIAAYDEKHFNSLVSFGLFVHGRQRSEITFELQYK